MDDRQPKYDPMDPFTLLCEWCGYVIEGLDQAGPCPECGKPIEESLANTRVGTAWQRDRTAWSLIRTWAGTLRHPLRTLDITTLQDEGGVDHAFASVFLALALFALGVWIPLMVLEPEMMLMWFLFLAAFCLFCWVLLMVLTAIEAKGLQFFAKRRGVRMGKNTAWAIVSHGTAGWAISIAGITINIWVLLAHIQYLDEVPRANQNTMINSTLGFLATYTALILVPAGFFFFEIFAWLGIRRCKYANHPARCSAARPGATP